MNRHLLNGLRVCLLALVLAWLFAPAAAAYAQTGRTPDVEEHPAAPARTPRVLSNAAQTGPAPDLEERAYEKIVEGRGNARAERYVEALIHLGEAVSLARQAGSKLSLALALHNTAEVRLLKGDPLVALRDYHGALGVYTELGHRSGVNLVQGRIDMVSRLVNPRPPAAAAAAAAEVPRPGAAAAREAAPVELQRPNRTPMAPASFRSGTGAAPVGSQRLEATDRLALIDQAVERIRRRQRGEEAPESPRVEGVEVTHFEPRAGPEDPRAWVYVESLRRKIGGNARYPEYARRKRQEGAVDVVFAVRENGAVEGVKVSRSSGFIVLDVEALRNVRESAPFDPMPGSIAGSPLTVRLTLNYDLPDTAVAP